MNYELATQAGLIVILHTDDTDFTDARRFSLSNQTAQPIHNS
jgi:hypothetical protein